MSVLGINLLIAVIISTMLTDLAWEPVVNDVFISEVKAEESKIDVDSMVDLAKEHLGTRYVYGGARPGAFDCSGFTMYIMGNFGIDMPHSASAQSRLGTRIEREDLKPGDLVFFATFGGRSITHVGMYIGEDSFIHAASNGVSINKLEESYYNRNYVTAARVIE